MTDSSRGFDEELRARLASLARALRSFKVMFKKTGDTTSNGQTRENTFKFHGKCCKIQGIFYQNARRERKPPVTAKQKKIRLTCRENTTKSKEKATKMAEGSEKEPQGHHQGVQRAKRVPPRCKRYDKRCPKGAERSPKGHQHDPKGPQKAIKRPARMTMCSQVSPITKEKMSKLVRF